MKTYIVLLRGINVGGHRRILMNDLKDLLHSIGFENSITYIQSGNIIFNSANKNSSEIAEKIQVKIKSQFGFDVPTFVLSSDELEVIIQENNYLDKELNQLYYTFLSSTPSDDLVRSFSALNFDKDLFTIKNKGVYLCFNLKASSSKLSNNLIEKKLQTTATTRNWKTMKKLSSIASEMN